MAIRTFRRPDRRRRPVRHRRGLSSAAEMSAARATSFSRAATASAAPGTCSAIPASAPTRDMFTLGYSFKPWTEPKAIADGPRILNYVRETAAENGIDKKIRFHHRVKRASWSTPDARWTVEAERTTGEGATETVSFTCNFLFMCSGYYKYESGYTPEFPARDRFRRPHRASAEMARRPRLCRQARGGDRLGRDRGDAGAGDGEDRRPRHHAAALADLRGGAAGAGSARQQIARASCRPSSPII